MKKLSILIAFLFSIAATTFAQYPVNQYLGSPTTLITSKGGFKNDSAFVLPVYLDTTKANLGYAKFYAGSYILTTSDTTLWVRNVSRSRWLSTKSSGGGSGVTVSNYGKNSIGDSTILLLSDGTRFAAKDSVGFTNVSCQNYLSGGRVSWDSLLVYNVTAAQFCINGTVYNSASGNITLNAADLTFPRRDIIAVDTNGLIVKITGTPSANPALPQIDDASQKNLTDVLINAGATSPSGVSKVVIWDENTGTPEWTGTSSGGTTSFTSITLPYHGALSTRKPSFAAGNTITYSGGTAYSTTLYNTLKFWIKRGASWTTKTNLSVSLINTTGIASPPIVLYENYGFSKSASLNDTWQLVQIPLDDFINISSTVNQLTFTFSGTNASPVYIDYIQLVGGTSNGGGGNYVTNIFRVPGVDSIYFTKNGINYAIKDSTGGGASLTNGSGTTANGSAVDLGGTATGDISIDMGINTLSVLGRVDIGDANTDGFAVVYASPINKNAAIVSENTRIDIFGSAPTPNLKVNSIDISADSIYLNTLPTTTDTTNKYVVIGSDGKLHQAASNSGFGNYIPLSGTTVGNPVTGDIETTADIKLMSYDTNPVVYLYDDGGAGIIQVGATDDATISAGITVEGLTYRRGSIYNEIKYRPDNKGFKISTPDTNARGITSDIDYSSNIQDLDYTQKIYVDRKADSVRQQLIDTAAAIRADFPTGGSGTVTDFTGGNLSPLFTTSVATSTTTPALTFNQSNANQYEILGRKASGAGAYSFLTADSSLIPALHSQGYYDARYAAIGGSGTDTAFIKITADARGPNSPAAGSKGLLLRNTTTGSSQASPSITWQGYTTAPNFWRAYINGTNRGLYFDYSTDTTTWTTRFSVDNQGTLSGTTTAGFNALSMGNAILAGTNLYIDGRGFGSVGATYPATSAMWELKSTSGGFLKPRMTTTQRDAISSPATGLAVYNTTLTTNDSYDGTRWTSGAKNLSNTATLDFGSTSPSTSTDLTITVTGAADGDPVLLGVPNAAVSANSCYTAWVSASNTVTVRFNNYQTVGSIDPTSATFKVTVSK